jgi:outer membrane biosynthesis protein TonB
VSASGVLWLPLGELLVERGLLSPVQLELALAEQRRTGLRLGEVLVSLGYVSEAALARMLLEQVGLSTPAAEPPTEPEPTEPEQPQFFVEPEPTEPEQPQFFVEPEPLVVEAVVAPDPEPGAEAVIVRMEDTTRERGKWWSRNGNKARVRELEQVLNDFEQRSRAMEADIMRVRTTLRNLRDARD